MAVKKSEPVTEAPTPQAIASAVEAILLSVDRPITVSALAAGVVRRPHKTPDDAVSSEPPSATGDEEKLIEEAVASLNAVYESTGRSFRIESIAGGLRVMTVSSIAPAVAAFHRSRQPARLTRAGVETLAIVAYKQPITRAVLESIRGVACGEVLRTLIDRRLVTIRGRAEELGRPLLYGTTKQFLDVFGLSSLKDLPSMTELKLGPLMDAHPGSGKSVKSAVQSELAPERRVSTDGAAEPERNIEPTATDPGAVLGSGRGVVTEDRS